MSTITMSPHAPDRTIASAFITTGSKRSEWFTDRRSPSSRARAISASHSATDSASGFSTNTWQPISSACIAIAKCDTGGVST
mgnify:CR=1 FL=1